MTVGDLNAQVGKELMFRPTIGKESLHDTSNDNGNKLINFAISRELVISSTYFPRKNIHKHTWSAPDGRTKTQIDHVIIDKRHQSSITNVRTYKGADRDSDHYLVVAKFSLELSTKWNRHQKIIKNTKLDRDKIKNYAEIKTFKRKVTMKLVKYNKIQSEAGETPTPTWEKIKDSLTKAGGSLRAGKTKKKHWFNNECQEVIKKRQKARAIMTQDPSNGNVEKYIRLRNEANKIIRLQKRIAENRKLEEIEIYKKDPTLFFEKCKSIKEGFKARMTIMKDGHGNLVSDPKKIAENFKEYFDSLLNDRAEQNTSYRPI